MPQLAYDKGSRRFDSDGRMHVDNCNIGRSCVSPYYGREIPNHKALGLDPTRIYRMYRDPAELERAADTFANLPVLIKHVAHTAGTPVQDLTVGTTGSNITFQNGHLVSDTLSVWTDEAIGLVVSGKQEQLSPSYNYRPDMTPGKSPDGHAYDGVMRDIKGNHVAIVEQGRQGPTVVVADSIHGANRMKNPLLAAALAAILPTATPEQLLALDTALAADVCQLSEADRKAAEDAWRGTKGMAADAALTEADRKAAWDAYSAARLPVAPGSGNPQNSPAQDTAPRITQADVDRAVAAGVAQARADAAALSVAQRAVEPVVGIVAMDSATEVYKHALTKLGVDVAGVHASAFPAMFALANKQRAPVNNGGTRPAMDAAQRANVLTSVPGLGNIKAR